MNHKGFNTNKLLDKLDIEIRNAKIVVSWEILAMFTELSYDEKIKYLAGEYYLSYSRVEAIIQPNFGEEI